MTHSSVDNTARGSALSQAFLPHHSTHPLEASRHSLLVTVRATESVLLVMDVCPSSVRPTALMARALADVALRDEAQKRREASGVEVVVRPESCFSRLTPTAHGLNHITRLTCLRPLVF